MAGAIHRARHVNTASPRAFLALGGVKLSPFQRMALPAAVALDAIRPQQGKAHRSAIAGQRHVVVDVVYVAHDACPRNQVAHAAHAKSEGTAHKTA